jgi:vancomycin permeability regulator SanA
VAFHVILLLGCAVRADGRPSAALARRIRAAAAAAQAHPQAQVFCSGGVGRNGPAEALVMAGELVRLGIEPDRLVLDAASLDTLQSAIAAARHMHRQRLRACLVCTDSYHVPRALALMRLLGVSAGGWPARAGLRQQGLSAFLWMRAREAVALPYDLALAMLKRGSVL